MAKKDNRFEIKQENSSIINSAQIIVDRVTGVNYLFFQSGYAGGLTPLLNSDGSVVVSPVSTYTDD